MVLTMSALLLTSSCDLTGGGRDDGKAIEKAVSEFLDSIADGSYAEDDYKSSLTKDKSFAKLKFEEDDAEKLMALAFEKVSYEITDAEGDEKDEEGTCDITLTAIDLEKILEDMEDGYDYETLEDAIKAKKAPTDEHEIVFDLEYDGEDWLITDLSDLSDILGKPFGEISFEEPEPDPEEYEEMVRETADQLMNALKAGDFSTIEQSTEGYYREVDFIQDGWTKARDVYTSLFGDMSWEITSVTAYSQTEYYADIDLTYKLFNEAVAAVYSDTDKMVEISKPALLGLIVAPDDSARFEVYMDGIANSVVEYNATAIPTTETVGIDMAYDEITKEWIINYVPSVFMSCADFDGNFDPIYNYTYNEDDVRSESILDTAAAALLAEGSITQEQYDLYMGNVTAPDETVASGVYTKETVDAAIAQQGWYDYTNYVFVTAYGPNTGVLGYVLFFNQYMPGLTVNCEYFIDGETTSFFSSQYVLEADNDIYDFGLTSDSVFPAGTYRVVLTLPDGSVLVDQTVEVTE